MVEINLGDVARPPPPPPGTAPPGTPAATGGISPEQVISNPSGGGREMNPLRLPLDPRGRALGRGASAALIASASLLPDVQDQIQSYANGMNLEPYRFGVDRDGQIYYSDPQNNGQPTLVIGQPGITASALSNVGNAVTLGGGIVGGTALPALGGIPGAAVGATVADVARQGVGRWVNNLDNPITGINWGHAATEGALNAGGQMIGRGAFSLFSRNPLGVSALDRINAQDPQARAAWDRITGISQGRHPVTGQPMPGGQPPPVDLDIGQVTNLASMQQQGRLAARDPHVMDTRRQWLENQQTQQIPARYRWEIEQNIGPRPGIEAAAGRTMQFPERDPVTGQALPRPGIRGAAQDIVETAERARTAAASPHYNAAFQSGVVPDVAPIVQSIETRLATGGGVARNSTTAQVLNEARTALTETVQNAQGQTITRPAQSYEALHNAKEVIDNILSRMARSANPPTATEITAARAELTPIQEQLTTTLRNAHPEYQRGYDVYRRMSPDVELVTRDVGALTRMTQPERMDVLDAVFSAGNIPPQQVERMRQHYLINGRINEWNAGLAQWMDGQLTRALTPIGGGETPNVSQRLFRIFDNADQRAVIQAAMGGAQAGGARNMENFFEVLEAARRYAPVGSTTASDLPHVGTVAGRGAQILGNLTSPSTYFNAGNFVVETINALRSPQTRQQFIQAFQSPDGMRMLEQLRMLSPRSQQARDIVAQFTANVLGNTARGELTPPATRAPTVTGPGQ
jgi:hypothetical protein